MGATLEDPLFRGIATRWRLQRLFRWPSSVKSRCDSLSFDARSSHLDGYANRHPRPPVNDIPSAIPIPTLMLSGRPSTVAWLVIAVVVSTLKRVLRRWSVSHVRMKPHKVSPLWADGDAASSVSIIHLIGDIRASTDHGAPRPVFGRTAHAVHVAHFAEVFLGKASAGRRHAALQRPCVNDASGSAVANTMPSSAAVWRIWRSGRDSPAPKTSSSYVREPCHARAPIAASITKGVCHALDY